MNQTAVAIVTADASGAPVAGVICYLQSPELTGGFLFAITNAKGYAEWKTVPVPFDGVLELGGAAQWYGDPDTGQAVSIPAAQNITIRVGPTPANPQDIKLPPCVRFRRPFTPAPRVWAGNMCGVRVEGIEAVPGGASDPSLVLSWFYDRYVEASRAKIRAVWKAKGLLDVLLSWPDSRAFGRTPEQFRETIDELQSDGFRCCPMLSAKGIDPPDVATILVKIAPVLPLLVRVVPRACIGWELSLWLSPTQVQELIDALAPTFVAYGCRVYVHFQEGYMAFQQDGGVIADFWNANIGKLTGVLYQKILAQNDAEFLDSINDCLQRCAGNFFMPPVIIDGHPVDFIGLELSAQFQFNGEMTEAQGDALGRLAINAPHVVGPAGEVMVMGSGNGS